MSESPYLPPELEQTIFRLAARDDISVAQNLLLVAHRVFDWVTAVIYEIVIYHDVNEWPPNISKRALKHHGKHVRHLLVSKHAFASRFMELCPNIVDLALWTGIPHYDEEIEAILNLPLTSLSININGLYEQLSSEPSEYHTFFSRITHLDVTNTSSWNPSEVLAHFTSLTHIAIPEDGSYEILEACADSSKTLKVIVWLSGEREDDSMEAEPSPSPIGDLRVVTVRCGSSYVWYWEESARGRKDMWSVAEAVVNDRLRGQGAGLSFEN